MSARRCRTCNEVLLRRNRAPGGRLKCVNCLDEEERDEDRRQWRKRLIWLGALAVLVAAAAVLSDDLPRPSPWRFSIADLVLIGFFAVLSVFPHELGHAAVCRMLGGHVPCIEIGRGPRGPCRRWLGLDWRIRSLSGQGGTYINACTLTHYRMRLWLITLAGPSVHLLILAGSVLLLTQLSSPILFLLVRDLALANSWDLLLNLIPLRSKSDDELENDGMSLVKIPFYTPDRIELELSTCYAYDHVHINTAEQAQRELCRLAKLAQRHDLPDFASPFIKAAVAWCELLVEGDLLRADALSTEALTEARRVILQGYPLADRYPFVEGTRGCAMILAGEQVEEGMAMVKRVREKVDDRHHAALYTCFLAMGATGLGRTRSAQAYRRVARSIDRECFLLARLGVEAGSAVP